MVKRKKHLIFIAIATLISIALYMSVFIDPNNFDYTMSVRIPKTLVIIVASFAIGTASIAFQSIINNRIVTPCLLGINAIYIFVHTFMIFIFGASSIIGTSKVYSFALDLLVMGFVSIVIYNVLFKKAKGNVLYILLIGTVIATFFTSLTTSVQRIMDPNEFLSLQGDLIASFNKVNSSIVAFSAILLLVIALLLRKDIALLDVITLGKHQAINLGVDHDKTTRNLIIGVTLYISIATALVGPISFLGLIIANVSRQFLMTYRHSYLMIGAALIGMFLLFTAQLAIEHIFNFNTNVTVFVNISGGIYFLYLVLKNRS